MSVEEKVRTFILENYLFTKDPAALANEDSLGDRGIVDSTGMLELINYLEEQFRLKVADDEMIPENLDSVSNIVAYVGRKQPG